MQTSTHSNKRAIIPGFLDSLGIAASAFCLLQCLALPLLVFVVPLTSAWLLDHKLFHLMLLVLIVPISLTAFMLGYFSHRDSTMWWPAALGLSLLLLASVLELSHTLEGFSVALVTSAGGMLMITAHWMNLRSRMHAQGRV
ncbi:MAG: MerC domain-containing protein [Pseudomonadota bacterium]